MKKTRRALISVYDKQGIVEFAKTLASMDVEILSTGGTAELLRTNGVEVKEIAQYTGFPEILGGRVKSLHPMIHGGILAERDNPEHTEALRKHNILPIDMVVVNFYPFADVVAKAGSTLEDAVENIDIGGPTMLRAAAKNFADVAVVTDPADYPRIARRLKEQGGRIDAATRMKLAIKAFRYTSTYDEAVHEYLWKRDAETEQMDQPDLAREFPPRFIVEGTKADELRYGENPHQRGVLYRDATGIGVAAAKQLHGKQLSYNNYLDLDAAYLLCLEFDEPAAVIIKHNNPCGVACDATLNSAFALARQTDPLSAYGAVVALNRTVDAATAATIMEGFVEAVLAPGFEEQGLEVLLQKKNIRILQTGFERAPVSQRLLFRQLTGGFLVQETDSDVFDITQARVVTKRPPSAEELDALAFAWTIVKHVRSNAIVLTRANRTVGIGAGQMSRVDSAKIAVMKACEPPKGAVCASDAFFPFRDGLDTVAHAGVTAVVQPGGSRRDGEVIQAADEHDMAMVFTGIRHFRH